MSGEVLDFQRLFEETPGLYLVLTRRLTIAAVTRAYLDATMRRREDIVGRGIFEVFPDNPDDRGATGVANLRASLEHVLREGRAHTMAVQRYDIERPAAVGGGFETRHWSPTNSPVLDDAGAVAWIVHSVTDVTEFVRLRQRDHAQARVQQALESRAGQMEVEIYLRAQEIQRANQALQRLHAELEARVAERTRELSAANEALLHSEEQRRQSQKLEAVGHLAGGVAHDFNNLLSVILSFSEMARWSLDAGHPALRDLEQVERAGQRAADLSRQLLAFSRRQVMDLRVLDLNAVVQNMSIMLRRVVGEHIEFRTVLSPGLQSVLADPGQIEQVLMNLVVNARDAMPDGGRLTVASGLVEVDAGRAEGWAVKPGPFVAVHVTDSGTGIPPAIVERVLEPFFTTKEIGRGTGLGLSQVYGFVRQSNGQMEIASTVGQGTTVSLYLPLGEGAINADDAPEHGVVHSGYGTVLVVEDEPEVLEIAVELFHALGYSVLTATDGAAALDVLKRPDSIDVLFTDVVMPAGINGLDLAREACRLRPDLQVILASGYPIPATSPQLAGLANTAFITKPYRWSELAERLKTLRASRDAAE